MKNKLKIIVVLLVILFVILIFGLARQIQEAKKLDIKQVEELILKDLNRERSDVIFLKTELDFEDGRYQYEVEVMVDHVKYEYEMEARKGTILKKKSKNENENLSTITLEQAKKIVLEQAGIDATTSSVTFTKEKQENGIYEIEFVFEGNKYEYKIGSSGQVMKQKKETITPPSNDTKISLEQAKTIVLNHAQLEQNANINFIKEKQDTEHGKPVYEIEFLYQGKKYEYEIDANTGEILEYEIDR